MLYIIDWLLLILSTSLPSHDINFEKCSDAIFGYSEGNDGRYGRYDLSMSYDDLWRVTSKSLDLWRHTASHSPRQYAGYSLSYGYGTDEGTRFRLSTIAETHYRAENDTVGARRQVFHRYQYDGSGNLTYEESGHPVAGGAVNWKPGERKLLWDAENRLRALDENGYVSTYVYDADGERVVKQHGGNRGLYVNSAGRDSLTETTAFTLYVNPYVTWTEGGKFVMHVYMGGSRVASRLGVAHLMGNNPIAVLGGVLPGHVLKDSMQKAAVVTSYGVFGVPYGGEDRTAAMPYSNEPGNFLGNFSDPNGLEGRQYFYHPDHLGSSTVITDGNGNVVQHIEYMPYGEVFMEEDNDTWNTPFKFNGKEYDEETGLYYYGKRFYDPKYSIWYGTDPLQKKYPEFSTYCFTIGNPVNYIDFDGDSTIVNNVGYIIRQNGIDNGVYLQKDEQSVLNFLGEIGKEVDISEVYHNLLLLNSKVAKRMFNPWKFKKLVATNGEWDLKNNSKTIYGISNDSKTKLLFNGHVMESQDVGNHHFGVMARSFGFPLYFALRAAGKYQITSGTSRKEWQVYRHDVIVSHSTGLSYRNSYMIQPYGDDPNDQRWIREGYKYFNVIQKWK